MEQVYNRYRQQVEQALAGYFTERADYGVLLESMRYSLLMGGKRLRPVLVLAFCCGVGGREEDAMPLACGVEMLHTYSLIHDDLPCMDDDDLRRGRPANHIVYGEMTAVLAGDALQAGAFEALLDAKLPADRTALAGRILALAAGARGICGGQLLDMAGEGRALAEEEILQIYRQKTASLMGAAARLGVVAGGGSEAQIECAGVYGENLGLAFQIRDDLLNADGAEEKLGKPVGSDAARGKSTLSALCGREKCEAMIREKTQAAAHALAGRFSNTEFLRELSQRLAGRSH